MFYYSVRVWDVAILIPNLIFMMYLMTKLSRARLKLRAANSPIFFTFYCLVIYISKLHFLYIYMFALKHIFLICLKKIIKQIK